MEPITVAKMGQ